jgi:aminoglycoside phosphotransferase (APT) family kinase protein
VTTAAGQRIGWDDVPVYVRAEVERILGSPVVEARSQTGGFSPGTADRVRTRDGRRAFVKAAGRSLNEKTVRLHRREIAVSAAMSERVAAPTLLGAYDDGDWVALVLSDVEGRHPLTPWDAVEVGAVLTTLADLAAVPLSAEQKGYRPAGEALAREFAGWRRIAVDPPPDLDPWALDHLDELTEAADAVMPRLVGESLLHMDIRADNLLVRPDGEVVLVDWPWAARGPAWLDTLSLLVNVNLFGGHDVEALAAEHVHADPIDVTGFLAGLTGYFLDAARQPGSPGLPTVRAFQAAEGRTTLAWVRRRLDP